jgi:hypothetical protein
VAGLEVSRQGIDQKIGSSLLTLRAGLDQCETVAIWLANTPAPSPEEDPLVVDFEYSEDEAYLIRLVFQQISDLRTSAAALDANARKLTGLE